MAATESLASSEIVDEAEIQPREEFDDTATVEMKKEFVPVLAEEGEDMAVQSPTLSRLFSRDASASVSPRKGVIVFGDEVIEAPVTSLGMVAPPSAPLGMVVPPKQQFDSIQETINQEIENLAESATVFLRNGDVDKDFHLVIFIHGFENSREQMEARNTLIDNAFGNRKVIATWLNWTSKESVLEYKGDQHTVDKLAKYFNDYLEMIQQHPVFQQTQIDIIAHSMGCHLLCKAIQDCPVPQLNVYEGVHLLCMAADEELGYYRKATMKVSGIATSWTHFFCRSDKALLFSNMVNMTYSRAGRSNIDDSDFVTSYQWNPDWTTWIQELRNQDFALHSYIDEILGNECEFKEVIKQTFDMDNKQNVVSSSPLL